jgi:hypothetical protein
MKRLISRTRDLRCLGRTSALSYHPGARLCRRPAADTTECRDASRIGDVLGRLNLLRLVLCTQPGSVGDRSRPWPLPSRNAPQRRGINERQVAVDQRLQALGVTMARPRFETFSIRGSWTYAAGSLHGFGSIEPLHACLHQQIIQCGRPHRLGPKAQIDPP